jgi:hypothetical protein
MKLTHRLSSPRAAVQHASSPVDNHIAPLVGIDSAMIYTPSVLKKFEILEMVLVKQ